MQQITAIPRHYTLLNNKLPAYRYWLSKVGKWSGWVIKGGIK